MKTIHVMLEDGRRLDCPEGTPVHTLAEGASPAGLPYLAALVNNDVVSLSYPLTVNSTVRLLAMDDPHGWRIYRRSLSFLLAKAVRDLYPEARLTVEHSFGQGLYCSFRRSADGGEVITREEVAHLDSHLHSLVNRDIPIERHKVGFTEAVHQFEEANLRDKLNLLKYRNPPRILVHTCEDFSDLAHGPLAPRTAALNTFALIPYPPGFVLHLPDRSTPHTLDRFEDAPHLFQIFKEHKEWGRILGVNTVGRLNEIVVSGEIENFILTAEALHEKKIARIADEICANRDKIRLILIAGPSSAGKTTFAKRLTTQLRVNGLRPITIGTDDYFVGIERNPRDEHGNPDFEHIEAVDLELLNEHLLGLVEGREIEMPRFNFETKQREFRGDRLRLGDGQMLIIEGIHGLNPRLTAMVPAESKFKVYVSALTQLSVDSNNRISTTDNRLMRRIVRDHKFRGYTSLDTLRQWPSVRRGEKRWIFPFQREANATFNSALDYELAILKPLVEPLLMQVKPFHTEYAESRRLSEFLINFLALSDHLVPPTSILREYVGGSSFHY